jgi:hypothetical protein
MTQALAPITRHVEIPQLEVTIYGHCRDMLAPALIYFHTKVTGLSQGRASVRLLCFRLTLYGG